MDERLTVFISYSREDDDFAKNLAAGLESYGTFRVLLDQKSIEAGENWRARLGALIGDADTVIFILSPRSARSDVCHWEATEAQRLSKRLLPVQADVLGESEPHAALAALQYVRFDPETDGRPRLFADGLTKVKRALDANVPWYREHTRLLKLAQSWVQSGGARQTLLVGKDVARAQAWLDERPSQAPPPSELHRNFIAESASADAHRRNEEGLATLSRRLSRNRLAVGILLLLFAGSAVAAGLAFLNYRNGETAVHAALLKDLEAKGEAQRAALVAERDSQVAAMNEKFNQLREAARRDMRAMAADAAARVVKSRALQAPERAPPGAATARPAPSRNPQERISQAAIEFIMLHEVGGEVGYKRNHSRVQRPLNRSGATIGIGYDLRYVDEKQLRSDWSELPKRHLDALAALAGKSGSEAEELYETVKDIEIYFSTAAKVYSQRTLLNSASQMEKIFPKAVELPPDSYGALLSLVLNRGNRLTDRGGINKGDSREEMRAIAKLLAIGAYDAIPDQIRSMKWLWWMSDRKDVTGLAARREAEADLFEAGLSAAAERLAAATKAAEEGAATQKVLEEAARAAAQNAAGSPAQRKPADPASPGPPPPAGAAAGPEASQAQQPPSPSLPAEPPPPARN